MLTSVRAVLHEAGPGDRRRTESHFLDMVDHVELTERAGRGTRDVSFGYARFENLADAPALHAIALDAVRTAGATIQPEAGRE